MLHIINDLSNSKNNDANQRRILKLFPNKHHTYPDSSEIVKRTLQMPEMCVGKDPIAYLEDSYLQKKGSIVTTGALIHIGPKDANSIREGNDEKIEKAIADIAEKLGITQFREKLIQVVKWVAHNHYDKEKACDGSLDISIDYIRFSIKNEIMIGNNNYKLPKSILNI